MSAMITGVTGRGAAERERVRFEGPDALERMADLGWDELVLGQPAPDVTRTAGWLAAATDDRERSALRALGVVRDGRLAAGILLSSERRLGLSILGEFGRKPETIPVTLTIHGGTTAKTFHYEVLNNARLSPVAISTTVFNALHGVNEYGDQTTYAMKGDISVEGFPEVKLQDMFSSADGMQPAAK